MVVFNQTILSDAEMGLLWHFATLDAAQSDRRRELLDSYGQVAQLSALIPLLAFPTTFLIRFATQKVKRFRGPAEKEHQSPQVSRFPKTFKYSSNAWWGRLQWELDEEVFEGWGTRKLWLVGGLWTLWLLVLAIKDTGDGKLRSRCSDFGFALAKDNGTSSTMF